MWWLVVILVLGWITLGPVAVLLVGGLLAVPRVRSMIRRPDWTRSGVLKSVAIATVLAVLVLLVPAGRLPILPGGGTWLAPAYLGRPAIPVPIDVALPAANEHLAALGRATSAGDTWSTRTVDWAGPVGDAPSVDSHLYGREHCDNLTFDSSDRVLALCRSGRIRTLRVLDSVTLARRAALSLSPAPGGLAAVCSRPTQYLDGSDRMVLPTTDRQVLVVRTRDDRGKPDLSVQYRWSLAAVLPADDCLVGVLPDATGRIWFASAAGVVGHLTPGDEGSDSEVKVASRRLREPVTAPFSLDPSGSAYVVTDRALYRLGAGAGNRVSIVWRRVYDRGTRTKPGQHSQGSGTAPVLLEGGAVAIADNSEPRMDVVFFDRSEGRELCKQPVFGTGASDVGLVSTGRGVVVTNTYGYTGPSSTLLGFGTTGGMARVDLRADSCPVAWTNPVVAPSAEPVLSTATGLLYTWAKRTNLWGVSAWYLIGLDVHTGQTRYQVRGGLGLLHNPDGSAVALAPDGAALVPTVAGMVRIHDHA